MRLTSQIARGLLAGALMVGPAAAQPAGDAGATADPVEKLANEGLDCYQKGDFLCAVKKYRKAYQFEPVGALLYNIAFIYDGKLDDKQLALDYYRRFVNAPDADADTRLAAYERIVELQSDLAKKTPPPPPPGPVKPPPPPPPPVAGWATVGIGGALLVTGGVFGLLASNAATTQEETSDGAEWNDLRDSGPTQALIADISLGLGAAAVITGLVLVLTHDGETPVEAKASEEKTGVRIGPSPDGLGFSLGGTF